MARLGVTKLYTAIPGGAGQGTALQAWMAASLVSVTVGALYTFGAGTAERNYWVLQMPSGAEILVGCPNGTGVFGASMFLLYETAETSINQPLMLMYAPDGGMEFALSLGRDPATQAFLDEVANGGERRLPSRALQMMHWRAGSGVNHQLHIIEDSNGDMVGFYVSQAGAIGSTTFMSHAFFADDAYDPAPAANTVYSPQGFVYVGSSNNTIKSHRLTYASAWKVGETAPTECRYALNTLPISTPTFDQLSSSRYPFTGSGKVHAGQMCLFPKRGGILRINKEYMRLTGVNHPNFKTSLGDDPNHEFTRIIQYVFTMWDGGMALPT